MKRRRHPRDMPLRFDDGLRGGITFGFATLLLVALLLLDRVWNLAIDTPSMLAAACTALAAAFFAYVILTHRVFTTTPAAVAHDTAIALVTAVASWLTVVYSFALRYFRLNAAGELFDFPISEEPEFADFTTPFRCDGMDQGDDRQRQLSVSAEPFHHRRR